MDRECIAGITDNGVYTTSNITGVQINLSTIQTAAINTRFRCDPWRTRHRHFPDRFTKKVYLTSINNTRNRMTTHRANRRAIKLGFVIRIINDQVTVGICSIL